MKALAVKGASDPVLRGFRGKDDSYTEMFQQVDRDGSEGLNFAEYLFLRKTASAWRQCASQSEMNYSELACAFRVIGDQSSITLGEAK